MSALFEEPYVYVIDSSALFDLKRNYPPNVFKGVWGNFESMCREFKIISCKEVQNEIKRGADWLVEWSDNFRNIFFDPTPDEMMFIGTLQEKYPHLVDYTSDRPAADPFVIASAHHYKLKIIQHEKYSATKQKLPSVAQAEGLECIMLPELFEIENWSF